MSQECLYCKKKVSMTKVFCSKGCKENYFQVIAIQVPKPFLKRIYFLCDENEREKEINKFAQRHKWRLDLLKSKIEDEAMRLGFTNQIA